MSTAESEALAARVFGCLASDPDRLGRFLALTGLAPDTIRAASREPRFLPAILSYVAADEQLLVTIAGELDIPPDRVLRADQILSPQADRDP